MVEIQDEVVQICSELIRIDTSNPGDSSGPGERLAAEYVAEKLADVPGLELQILESAWKRTSVVARLAGHDRSRPPLLVHTHLDVVPAPADGWRFPPFAGAIHDDCVWGRGAVDMKGMIAMLLTVIRQRASQGRRPMRDLVLAFLADEEAGGVLGSQWLVDNRPHLFEGCTEAVGEVGGFSLTVSPDARIYLIQVAEKGRAWLKLTARGTAGHGSMISSDNAIIALAEAIKRLGDHVFPTQLTESMEEFVECVSRVYGAELDLNDPISLTEVLGPASRMIDAALRHTATPTMLQAGYKANVVPEEATAIVDGRFLPGGKREFLEKVDEIIGPKVLRDDTLPVRDGVETIYGGALVSAMHSAINSQDPTAVLVPYCLSGGTDAKAFSKLGIRCFGFAPLRLPADLDFTGMFHGVNERIPISGLNFGLSVYDHFFDIA